MNPTSVIALGQSHQLELRRAAAHAQAGSEISVQRRQQPLRTRLGHLTGVLALPRARRRAALVTPATRRA